MSSFGSPFPRGAQASQILNDMEKDPMVLISDYANVDAARCMLILAKDLICLVRTTKQTMRG